MSTQNTGYVKDISQEPSILEKVESGIKNIYEKIVDVINPNHPVDLYNKKDFKTLANSEILSHPINDKGDTIVHVMAYNLDKNAFEQIKNNNPNVLTKELINKPNNLGQTPIFKALQGIQDRLKGTIGKSIETVKEQLKEGVGKAKEITSQEADAIKKQGNDLISYMKNILGANINIPDIQGRIISKTQTTKASQEEEKSKEKLKQLNETVIQNIRTLSKLNKSKEEKSPVSCNIQKITEVLKPNNPDLDFIKQLVEHYTAENPQNKCDIINQKAGYSGRRRIRSYLSELTETGINDSFVSKKRNQLLNQYESPTIDQQKKKGNLRNKELTTEESDLETSDLKDIGELSIESATSDFDVEPKTKDVTSEIDDLKDITSEDVKIVGGRKYSNQRKGNKRNKENTEESRGSEGERREGDLGSKKKKSNTKSFTSGNWRTEDFNLSTVAKDEDEGEEGKGEEEIRSSSAFSFEDDEQSRPRPPRNPKIDEIYKSFIKKLMDEYGLDEETARLYRSIIKILIGEDNPELRKRENDELKVKLMEEIFADRDRLDKMKKRADAEKDRVRKFMSEQKEKSEQRRKEREERRKQWQERKGKQSGETTSEGKGRKKTEETTSESAAETTSEEAPAKPKRGRKSAKVAENGYLESDEILFSPNY